MPAGEVPSEAEVERRLDYLSTHGPTPFAFTFYQRFTIQEMLQAAA